ncbi:MAG: metallophosphoesterase [Spirochaetia bacterium]|nr:metallophosphoesterase [Spirochaetia bacterium]
MKIAIISDTHLGDPCNVLVKGSRGNWSKGRYFDACLNALGENNDYLILVGDAFEFSTASYIDSYSAGKYFFNAIVSNNIAKRIIYTAGNHDYDFWDEVEYEVNIINRVKEGKEPKPFKWVLPGLLDENIKGEDKFFLPDVSINEGGGHNRYGGLFLDGLTDNKSLPFYVAYPNIYLRIDNKTILLTHGHFVHTFWAYLGELAFHSGYISKKDYNLKNAVAANHSLNQLSASGVGQSGILTPLVQKVQKDTREKNMKDLEEFLNNIQKGMDKMIEPESFFKEKGSDLLLELAKRYILHTIGKSENSRFNPDYIYKEDIKEKIVKYLDLCASECENLNIPKPDRVIIGHTHVPLAWDVCDKNFVEHDGKKVFFHNTGGWIERVKGDDALLYGAEIFTYETGKGIKSVRIK